MRSPKLGFHLYSNIPTDIGRARYSQYYELHLEVRTIGVYSSPRVCRFQWQAGMLKDRPASEGFDAWYAGTMHVQAERYRMVDAMKGALRIARILESEAPNMSDAPLATARALEAAGVVRIAYDDVESEYRTIDCITMAPLAGWMDDYGRTGAPHCTFHVTAETEEEAQRLMLKQFGAQVTRDDGEGLRRWVDAGKPVRLIRKGAERIPSITDAIGDTLEVRASLEAQAG